MRYRSFVGWPAVALALLAICTSARAGDAPDGQRWWSHVTALADDKLEGRNTGSAGHRKAAEYVAREFARAGLEPAGTDGFFQTVKLTARTLDESQSSLTLVRDSGQEELTLGADAILTVRVLPPTELEAELVFAGHGLSIPEAHHDDFMGLDVRDKLVVFLSGAPKRIPGPLAAHMQSIPERAAVFKEMGAKGAIMIQNPKNMDIPWERAALARFMPAMSLADPALDETHGLKLVVTVNPARRKSCSPARGTRFARSSRPPTPTSRCRISCCRRT